MPPQRRDAFQKAVPTYAALGWRMLLLTEDRAPHALSLVDGKRAATTNIDLILSRLAQTRWTANLGIQVPDACVVLDIDPRNGGKDSWTKLTDAVPELLGRTLIQRTPRDGVHRFYQDPERKIRKGMLTRHGYHGIDVLHSNRYVAVAPSVGANGKPYCFPTLLTRIAPLPDALLSHIEAPVRLGAASQTPQSHWELREAENAAQAFILNAALPSALSDTGSTGSLCTFAWHLGRNAHALSDDFIRSALDQAAAAFGKDVSADDSLQRKLRESFQAGRANPYLPPDPSNELPKWLRRD